MGKTFRYGSVGAFRWALPTGRWLGVGPGLRPNKYPLIIDKLSDYQLFKQTFQLMLSKEHLTLEGLKKYYRLERSLMSLFQRHEGWVRPLCMNKGGGRSPPPLHPLLPRGWRAYKPTALLNKRIKGSNPSIQGIKGSFSKYNTYERPLVTNK